MGKRFAQMNAKNYIYRDKDGNPDRSVISLYRGNQKLGFIEYDHARQFVDLIHDLCDAHETQLREAASNE